MRKMRVQLLPFGILKDCLSGAQLELPAETTVGDLLTGLGERLQGQPAVASAHRGAAFEACRWLIDTLKKTVPIWKKETFVGGAVWADGELFPEKLVASTVVEKNGSGEQAS